MKAFVFNLQTLLDHRKTVEEMRLMELARLRMEEQALQVRLAALRASRQEAWESLVELAATGADSVRLARASEHCEAVGDDVRLGEMSVEAARKNVDHKLAEVVEASRERKLMEQLRDKRRREYELEVSRLEQKELDDITGVRYGREWQ